MVRLDVGERNSLMHNIIFDPQNIYKSITCVYPMPSIGNVMTKLVLCV